MPAYVTLEETWIVIEGLPPKWISWNIISQISTMLGVLVNVDWHTIFRSFYEKVRIQVAVRDSTKIPRDRMVEIHHELYLLKFTVESEAVSGHESDNPPGPDDNNPSQNKHTEDEFDSSGDDLLGEDMDTGNNDTNTKDKHQTIGSNGARTMQKCSTPAPRANEENLVSSKLLGEPMTKSYLEAVKKRHYDTMVTLSLSNLKLLLTSLFLRSALVLSRSGALWWPLGLAPETIEITDQLFKKLRS